MKQRRRGPPGLFILRRQVIVDADLGDLEHTVHVLDVPLDFGPVEILRRLDPFLASAAASVPIIQPAVAAIM